MIYDRRPSPDGDPGPTGASDPYLGNLAHQSHVVAEEGPSVTPDSSVGLAADERSSEMSSAYDPYLVEVARSARTDF